MKSSIPRYVSLVKKRKIWPTSIGKRGASGGENMFVAIVIINKSERDILKIPMLSLIVIKDGPTGIMKR